MKNPYSPLALLILLVLASVSAAFAQRGKAHQVIYRGFDVSFGFSSAKTKSDINAINNLLLITEGGSAGVVFGSEILRTSSKVGFFYSAGSVPQTIDKFNASQEIRFFPFSIGKAHVQIAEPYLLGGISYDIFKFAGQYLSSETQVLDRYIGKVSQFNLTGGIGMEYKLFDNVDFMHLYGEVLWSQPLSVRSEQGVFRNTKVGNAVSCAIGVRFGIVN